MPRIVLWWELRRIAYNAIIGLSGFISIALFASFVNGWFDYLTPQFLQAMTFFFFANFFYTGGWVVELIIRVVVPGRFTKFGERAFKYGLFFAVFVTFLPTIVALVVLLLGGEVASPYSKFTTTEPDFMDIVGEYQLTDSHVDLLRDAGLAFHTPPCIHLYRDSSFAVENMPGLYETTPPGMPPTPEILQLPTPYNDQMSESRLYSAYGHWKLEPGGFGESWEIRLSFDEVFPSTGSGKSGTPFTTWYNLQNEEPPYRIYIIRGDPDSWKSFIFDLAR